MKSKPDSVVSFMGGWQGSTRRERLPADWNSRRQVVGERAAGRCEGISLDGGPRWHVADCDGVGAECDHDIAGDNHELSNLRWLSVECHKFKTQAERPKRRRAMPRHPSEGVRT